MKLQSINLRNVYNFGEDGTPELSKLKQFNLLIGKNGSGKSNVLRAISNLKTESRYECQYPQKRDGYTLLLHHDILRRTKEGPGTCDVSLIYDNHKVEFIKEEYKVGDFRTYSASYLKFDQSKESFYTKTRQFGEESPNRAILNFAISYVFNLEIEVMFDGIGEAFSINKKGGRKVTGTTEIDSMASGVLSVANLLMDFLLAQKTIICIDEPEVHIEPKILRRVMDILFWLSTRKRESEIEDLFSEIQIQWNKWLYSRSDGNTIHWKGKKGVINFESRQLFIATHSSVLINIFLEYSDTSSIYEFDLQWQHSSVKLGFTDYPDGYDINNLVATVKKTGQYPHSILDNLGTSGSDLLQANGIIWVEGPSDVIYIRKWLELYAINSNLPILSQGSDYEFQMFGGTLLDSLCLIKEGLSKEEDELKKIVSMFSFSRNAFLITDSDAIVNDKGVIVDQSKFKNAKEFIAKEFDEKENQGFNLGIWYKKNNTDIRTLEDYLDDETLSKVKGKSYSKKIYAERCVEYWGNTKLLSDFKHNLKDEIKILYDLIKEWNE